MDKELPHFKTDEELEQFLEQDLTDYINLKNFHKVSFEFQPKSEKVNLRLPANLLSTVKERAQQEGIPYQKYIRLLVERSLSL